MKCRCLYLMAPERLIWIEEDLPTLGSQEVLVESTVGAVSLGSELPQYLGMSREVEDHYPRNTGYENVATIQQCGSRVTWLSPGDRIVASYGHKTHAVLCQDKVIPAPHEIPDTLALLAILSCDVAKGIRKLRPRPEERVLVTGAGAIGLLTVFMLRAYGVCDVEVIEPIGYRRELAFKLGATKAVSPAREKDLKGYYSAAVECSDSQEAFSVAQHKAASKGRICILSDGNLGPLLLTSDFHEKELSVVASSDGKDYRRHAEWFFGRIVEAGAGSLDQLFEHEILAETLPSAFKQIAENSEKPIKILVRY